MAPSPSRPPIANPPSDPPADSRGAARSWRPLFLPQTISGARRGPTRVSEIPPPLSDPPKAVMAAGGRARQAMVWVVGLAVAAVLVALAYAASLRIE
jgi:hypothetical protein